MIRVSVRFARNFDAHDITRATAQLLTVVVGAHIARHGLAHQAQRQAAVRGGRLAVHDLGHRAAEEGGVTLDGQVHLVDQRQRCSVAGRACEGNQRSVGNEVRAKCGGGKNEKTFTTTPKSGQLAQPNSNCSQTMSGHHKTAARTNLSPAWHSSSRGPARHAGKVGAGVEGVGHACSNGGMRG
jgi:hypothetical protein